MGVHPYHHRCLDVYACLASACRVCAKLGMGAAAMRRAALFGLLQAGAAEAVLAAGMSTMPRSLEAMVQQRFVRLAKSPASHTGSGASSH